MYSTLEEILLIDQYNDSYYDCILYDSLIKFLSLLIILKCIYSAPITNSMGLTLRICNSCLKCNIEMVNMQTIKPPPMEQSDWSECYMFNHGTITGSTSKHLLQGLNMHTKILLYQVVQKTEIAL